MNQPENSKLIKDKKSKRIIFSLLALLVLLVVVLLIRENKHQEQIETVIQYEQEKNTLRDNLDDLIDEHEILKDEYSDLSSQLLEKDSTIMAYANDIKKLLRTKGQLQQARQKIRLLKDISMKYVSAIDSLYTLNQSLQNENDSVRKVNRLISTRNRTLEKNNQLLSERVYTASMLRIENIEVEGVYYRSSGREVVTTRASKIQNFSICYDIIENKVTDPGLKNMYVRIIDPNNRVLNVANKIQELNITNDSIVQYTVEYSFDYSNKKISECQLWTRGNVLKSGVYSFEFIVDGQVIGLEERKFR
jgi:cell division protein FtsB